jgi:hypothetical protein
MSKIRLSVGDARAFSLANWASGSPEVRHVEDVAEMRQIAFWNPGVYLDALDRCVASGAFVESPHGRLLVDVERVR